MGLTRFDVKFGEAFLKSVPDAPGVYFIHDDTGALIYVGKAKSLRRRLSQYRNAKRKKSHRKMKTLVVAGASITWEVCETELDASLREIRLIQQHRPGNNIAGAFHFMYPLIGIRLDSADLRFCFTTLPELFPDYRFFGAFRSREVSAEAFFALMRLLRFVGHPVTPKGLGAERGRKRSWVYGFRRLPTVLSSAVFELFFRGASFEALEELSLNLLGNAGARAKAADVQEDLRAVRRFWKEEALELAAAIVSTGFDLYPVPQVDRDPLFLRHRANQR